MTIPVVVLSLGTDKVLHMFQVYPPWGQTMHDPELNLLALSYRIVYTVVGATSPRGSRPRIRCVMQCSWEL